MSKLEGSEITTHHPNVTLQETMSSTVRLAELKEKEIKIVDNITRSKFRVLFCTEYVLYCIIIFILSVLEKFTNNFSSKNGLFCFKE